MRAPHNDSTHHQLVLLTALAGLALVATSLAGPAAADPEASASEPAPAAALRPAGPGAGPRPTAARLPAAALREDGRDGMARSRPAPPAAAAPERPPAPPAPPPPPGPVVFARAGGIPLALPSHESRFIGYHESATAAADALTPDAARPGHVLATRNRGTAPTSAVDVAVPTGTPVLAPVTGVVVEVSAYRLYDSHDDTRIRIVPDADPSRVVTILHTAGPAVGVGQRVEAGITPIAAHAVLFPFTAQIELVAGRLPHVHIEVRRR